MPMCHGALMCAPRATTIRPRAHMAEPASCRSHAAAGSSDDPGAPGPATYTLFPEALGIVSACEGKGIKVAAVGESSEPAEVLAALNKLGLEGACSFSVVSCRLLFL